MMVQHHQHHYLVSAVVNVQRPALSVYYHNSYIGTRAKDLEKTSEYNLLDCIECGCCSYVCPSEIPLVHYFRFAKTETMNQQQEHKKADIARIRHENRLARHAQEQQEKELRQKQRKAALAVTKAAKEKERLAAEAASGSDSSTTSQETK